MRAVPKNVVHDFYCEIEGLSDLISQFRNMDIKADETLKMLKLAMEPIRAEAANTIPRSTVPRRATEKNSWRTGLHAADNLLIDESGMFVGVTAKKGLQDGPFFYIRFGEFGTEREAPRHWIRAAAAARALECESIIERELKKKVGG